MACDKISDIDCNHSLRCALTSGSGVWQSLQHSKVDFLTGLFRLQESPDTLSPEYGGFGGSNSSESNQAIPTGAIAQLVSL